MALFVYLEGVQGAYLKYIAGLSAASTLLLVIGLYDDLRGMRPWVKFMGQLCASFIIIAAGIGITHIQNPLGGLIMLEQITIPIISLYGTVYKITLLADIIAIIWIIAVINVMNFLDGLDSLAAGVSLIAFLTIGILSLSPTVAQPLSGIIALIAAACVLGFAPFNINPARMFMGDTGSHFLGLVLAVLAIISGGKLATALLVFGLPMLDTFWVIASRIRRGVPIWQAGRDHLHHKLLMLGLTQRQVAGIFLLITILFGSLSFVTHTSGKAIALLILTIAIIVLLMTVDHKTSKIMRSSQ